MNQVTHPLSSADINIFHQKSAGVAIRGEYRYNLHFDTYVLIF